MIFGHIWQQTRLETPRSSPHLDDRHAAAEASNALVQLLLLVLGLGLQKREGGKSDRQE